ncbi:hypothetical protein NH8B_3595 [Pseudogulbenkiania sp. NH8B]|uniref:hypothetical protein n=1 Tax=Pseudogulbenkiania sp. (strain NH8B) TaxID=748280 RepID=UPI000227A693|nr:hypothetical protein [Pseudogulbenkiania sp. NH8B]BAK78344.1 hypothetical protein NH8B_3595 [Pseudogulbenkiania sp. NH8B]
MVYKSALAMLSLLALPGCVVMQPDPTLEAIKLISVAITGVASMTPGPTQNTILHPHAPVKNLCIEWNRGVALPDFVPALQSELQRHSIESRVYEAGMQPSGCGAELAYTAFLQWEKRSFGDDYAPYLSYAALTLRQNGTVLASANYEMGVMGYDKWTPTRKKLAPLVDAVLAGN